MLPDFLGIGVQKAGTTWLHSMLSAHNEIWLPHVKELHYFDRKYESPMSGDITSGISSHRTWLSHVQRRFRRVSLTKLRERVVSLGRQDWAWEMQYMLGRRDDRWYSELFEAGAGRIVGEITPAYSCLSATTIAHIHQLMPEARLILLLRDPVQRAWSHAKMDISRVTRDSRTRVDDSRYVEHFNSAVSTMRGDYLGCINRWLSYFPAPQLFIGFFDEIHENPKHLLAAVCDFLGVNPPEQHFDAHVRKKVNVGLQVKIPTHLERLLALQYLDSVRTLADRFGRYPQHWLAHYEDILS